MSRNFKVERFAFSARFQSEIQKVEPDVLKAAQEVLAVLQKNPQSKKLRLHPLTGLPKPMVWKIDVFLNRSWQITFEINGTTAELKRIATHKSIDREPR